MKPAIIFDLGKVLVDFDYAIGARKIAARSAKKLTELHRFLGGSDILARFESGVLTRHQFFGEMKEATGFLGEIDEFVGDFADIFLPIPAMIELHAELRRRGFETFIFSNTNDIAVEHVRHNFPFFSNFDGYIYSYRVGAMKPLPQIYDAMEKLCGRKGKEIIYLDDRPENIEAGARRGWQSILHESPEKSEEALKNLLP
ncbi:MAG: HAD family hydrolase [Limisphaerales bacterium]